MSFRLFSFYGCQAALAGLICVASGGSLQAGDMRPQPIEIVPVRGTTISTNVNQSRHVEARSFEEIFPGATHSYLEVPGQEAPVNLTPPPRQQAAPTQREKDWMDRRKNWVFMTPEDMAPETEAEDVLQVKKYDKDGQEKKPTTALERYYERLSNGDQAATTNRLGKPDIDPWDRGTNSVADSQREEGGNNVLQSPLDTRPSATVFQSARPNSFSDIFGSDADVGTPSPSVVRAQEEQQAHIESFKQIWDLGQPAAAPAASSFTPAVGESSAGASSYAGFQPPAGALSPSVSAPIQAAPLSVQPSVTTMRTMPPRPDFSAPQRRF